MNRTMKTMGRHGFTLVEIMIVVAIIALLASIAIPNLFQAIFRAQVTRVANDLRKFGDAFQMYSFDTGQMPADTHLVLPPGMDLYINDAVWSKEVWGGRYNWEGPQWGVGGTYPYAGISLFETTATTEQLTALDEILDNGDLSTGNFRQTPDGRYTYIIEE